MTLKEQIIERTLYSGTNNQVVYNEIYKINNVTARIKISTDYPNTFGAYIEVLDTHTGKWNELYTCHKSLLNVYKEPSYEYYCEAEELKRKRELYISKFSKDVSDLKGKLVQLMF